MKILALDHVQLSIPPGGEGQARLFYRDLLGFSEVPKPPDLAKRGGAWFEQGRVRLHLGIEPDFRPHKKAHPAFLVDDLSALAARLQGAGCDVDTSQPPLDGYRRLHALDPFGNRLEFLEKL
jgi:catechol 2,3-dioxygenase-like lactoylglutathione lyase family enzyme